MQRQVSGSAADTGNHVANVENTATSGGVTLTSGSGDFAELLPRARESESIEAGDVVGVFGGEITKRTAGAEQVMVVTDRALILGNDPGSEARDDGTARSLAPSDYSPVADGPLIGKAWEASSGGRQRVNALVGTVGDTAALRSVVQRQEKRIRRLQRNDERLERRIQKLETAVEELMESACTERPRNQ